MKTIKPIIRSLVTEKSAERQPAGQYTFMVNGDATKITIKKSIKKMYGVEVKTVRIMISPKKTRIMGKGREWIKRPQFKKAIVTLKDKKTIDPNKIKESKSK